MGEHGSRRESDEKIYTHRLPEGSDVWSHDPTITIKEIPTYETTTPWLLHIRGEDRRKRRFVPAEIGAIINKPQDGEFTPGDLVYVRQATLNERRRQQLIMTEIADATLSEQKPEKLPSAQRGKEYQQLKLTGDIFTAPARPLELADDSSFLRETGHKKRRKRKK